MSPSLLYIILSDDALLLVIVCIKSQPIIMKIRDLSNQWFHKVGQVVGAYSPSICLHLLFKISDN